MTPKCEILFTLSISIRNGVLFLYALLFDQTLNNGKPLGKAMFGKTLLLLVIPAPFHHMLLSRYDSILTLVSTALTAFVCTLSLFPHSCVG